jgi:hypothetical protein
MSTKAKTFEPRTTRTMRTKTRTFLTAEPMTGSNADGHGWEGALLPERSEVNQNETFKIQRSTSKGSSVNPALQPNPGLTVLPGKSAQRQIASTVAANPAGNLPAGVATTSRQLEKPQCQAPSLGTVQK